MLDLALFLNMKLGAGIGWGLNPTGTKLLSSPLTPTLSEMLRDYLVSRIFRQCPDIKGAIQVQQVEFFYFAECHQVTVDVCYFSNNPEIVKDRIDMLSYIDKPLNPTTLEKAKTYISRHSFNPNSSFSSWKILNIPTTSINLDSPKLYLMPLTDHPLTVEIKQVEKDNFLISVITRSGFLMQGNLTLQHLNELAQRPVASVEVSQPYQSVISQTPGMGLIDLPIELRLRVLNYLPNVNDLRAVAQVNRGLAELTKDLSLWKHFLPRLANEPPATKADVLQDYKQTIMLLNLKVGGNMGWKDNFYQGKIYLKSKPLTQPNEAETYLQRLKRIFYLPLTEESPILFVRTEQQTKYIMVAKAQFDNHDSVKYYQNIIQGFLNTAVTPEEIERAKKYLAKDNGAIFDLNVYYGVKDPHEPSSIYHHKFPTRSLIRIAPSNDFPGQYDIMFEFQIASNTAIAFSSGSLLTDKQWVCLPQIYIKEFAYRGTLFGNRDGDTVRRYLSHCSNPQYILHIS